MPAPEREGAIGEFRLKTHEGEGHRVQKVQRNPTAIDISPDCEV